MPACWGATPAATTASRPKNSTAAIDSASGAPSPKTALDESAEPNPDRKVAKVISRRPIPPRRGRQANKRVQFGYGLN